MITITSVDSLKASIRKYSLRVIRKDQVAGKEVFHLVNYHNSSKNYRKAVLDFPVAVDLHATGYLKKHNQFTNN